jgi:hypothetical protein
VQYEKVQSWAVEGLWRVALPLGKEMQAFTDMRECASGQVNKAGSRSCFSDAAGGDDARKTNSARGPLRSLCPAS